MTSYAIGHLHNVEVNSDIVAYLNGIDATLAPYGGKFIIHGGEVEQLEGNFSGDLIVIAFPNHKAAQDWYDSREYQALLPLRTKNSQGDVFLIGGVDEDHKATGILGAPG